MSAFKCDVVCVSVKCVATYDTKINSRVANRLGIVSGMQGADKATISGAGPSGAMATGVNVSGASMAGAVTTTVGVAPLSKPQASALSIHGAIGETGSGVNLAPGGRLRARLP